jgi:hypothetical protein
MRKRMERQIDIVAALGFGPTKKNHLKNSVLDFVKTGKTVKEKKKKKTT